MSVQDKFKMTLSLDIINETTGVRIHDTPSMNWYNLSYEDVTLMEAGLIDWLKSLNMMSLEEVEKSKNKVPNK